MGLLSDMSWKEVEKDLKQTTIALIPVGSTEQHGFHMPMGSDTYCAYEVARRTAAKEKVIVTPAIPFGISHCHMSFPGTITLSCDTLYRIVTDICTSLNKHGVDKFIFVNGHGHNMPTLQTAMDEFKKDKEVLFFVLQWWIAGMKLTPELWSTDKSDLPDGHAADVEASAMLAINSSLVNRDKLDKVVMGSLGKTRIKFIKSTAATLANYPVDLTTIANFKQFTQSGLIGSSLSATQEKGEMVLDKVSDFLAELVRELKKV
jgi:creatinine amidohydrolase